MNLHVVDCVSKATSPEMGAIKCMATANESQDLVVTLAIIGLINKSWALPDPRCRRNQLPGGAESIRRGSTIDKRHLAPMRILSGPVRASQGQSVSERGVSVRLRPWGRGNGYGIGNGSNGE